MIDKLHGYRLSGSDFRRSELLIDWIADLKEKQAISEIKDMLASNWDPADIMGNCIQAMNEVGKRFQEGRYFIAALIMAGDIMRQATEIIETKLIKQTSDLKDGIILLGTIQGDIHDLGKDLFAILARCDGFQVVDLGVDVEPECFLEEAKRIRPDMIGISCLITSVLPELKNAVELLRNEFQAHQAPTIIGGHCIDEHIFNHVQSDYWAQSATHGIQICRKMRKC